MTDNERDKFGVASKQVHWKTFLSMFVQQIPAMFVRCSPLVFVVVFGTGIEMDFYPSFTTPLSDMQDIIRALFANRPFKFVIEFMASNMCRFDLVWLIIWEIYEPETFDVFVEIFIRTEKRTLR
jgi:hypothetical protein